MKVFLYTEVQVREINVPDRVTPESFESYMEEEGWPDSDLVSYVVENVTEIGVAE